MAKMSLSKVAGESGVDGVEFTRIVAEAGLGDADTKAPTQEAIDLGLSEKSNHGTWYWDSDKLIQTLRDQDLIPKTRQAARVAILKPYLLKTYDYGLKALAATGDDQVMIRLKERVATEMKSRDYLHWSGQLDETAPAYLIAAIDILKEMGQDAAADELVEYSTTIRG